MLHTDSQTAVDKSPLKYMELGNVDGELRLAGVQKNCNDLQLGKKGFSFFLMQKLSHYGTSLAIVLT